MDCSLPGSSVHGISQERILEWVAISFSRGSSQPRDQWCFSTFISTVFKSYRIVSVSYHDEDLSLVPNFNTISLLLLFSHSVVSNSLRPHGLHARLPCPSSSPRVCSNSSPLNQWCHPTILSSIIPFSPCLHFFPASGSFLMRWLFVSGGQSIGASVSASVLLMNIQDQFPLGWMVWACSPRDSQEYSPTPQFKSINSLAFSLLYSPTLTSIHGYWEIVHFHYTFGIFIVRNEVSDWF